jgi:hypothetical protein
VSPCAAAAGAAAPTDQFTRADFNSVDFINRLFPDEHSLAAGVDPFISKLKLRVR